MKIIAVKVFQLKQLKRRNLKKIFRLEPVVAGHGLKGMGDHYISQSRVVS